VSWQPAIHVLRVVVGGHQLALATTVFGRRDADEHHVIGTDR